MRHLLILILAYAVFFRQGGETDAAGYVAYSSAGAILMAGAVLLSAVGQHRRIARPSPPRKAQQGGIAAILREMKHTLSNRAFLWLVFAALFGFINQGISFSLTNYLIGFLWLFDQGEKTAYAVMLFGTMIAAFIIVAPLARWLGKREAAIISGLASLAFNTLLYLLYYFDLFPMIGNKPSVAVMFGIVFLSNTFAIALMVLSSSMMADVVEASQSETGRRSEGLFFAGYFFMQKCATGIGIFVAGQILSWALFPRSAKPGEVAGPVLDNVALGYVFSILVIGSVGLLVMRRFPIDRADHESRLAKLDAEARADPDGTRILP